VGGWIALRPGGCQRRFACDCGALDGAGCRGYSAAGTKGRRA
jgi:hypothetical protein